MNIMSSGGYDYISDIIRVKYGYSPATYGRIDSKGNPLETVLSAATETCLDECLDYILLMNYKVNNIQNFAINLDKTGVEPFYVKNFPITQISDHAGVQISFKIL